MDDVYFINRYGRRVAYAEYGDPEGAPVVFCHGWMASRLTRHPDDGLTASLGVRLITIDRAGIGRSDPDPEKSLLSFPADVEAVADKLALERLFMLGHSGGGPYALACAHALGGRVASAAVVSGFAPFDRPDAYAGMTKRMRGCVRVLRAAPWLAGPLMRGTPKRYAKDPDKAFAQQFGGLCDADRVAFENVAWRENVLASAVEGLAGGHSAMAVESQLLFVRPWGFSPAEIRLPRRPLVRRSRHARFGGRRPLPGPRDPDARLGILPSEGHTLYLTEWPEILRSLMVAAPALSELRRRPAGHDVG
jgi:pimeloyl-ACP methyl ester carboxylesterase